MANTKPSTIFGKFFAKIGIWHPKFEGSIEEIYNQLNYTSQGAIQFASGSVAIVNANLQAAPEVLFDLIQSKFPNVTKESIADTLNQLNRALQIADEAIPETFDEAIKKLQDYLSKYEEQSVWIAATKMVVSVLARVLGGEGLKIETISIVLDFVYRNFIKGKVA